MLTLRSNYGAGDVILDGQLHRYAGSRVLLAETYVWPVRTDGTYDAYVKLARKWIPKGYQFMIGAEETNLNYVLFDEPIDGFQGFLLNINDFTG